MIDNLKIVRNPKGVWTLRLNRKIISVGGVTEFETFEELSKQIEERGLHIWNNSSVHTEAESFS